MRYLIMIALMAGVGFAQDRPEYNKNVNADKWKGTDSYCAAYAKGFGVDSTGDFLQAFPLEKCLDVNQSGAEQKHFVFVVTPGGLMLANADSSGTGFKLDLTAAEKIDFKVEAKVVYIKPVKIIKAVKPKGTK